MRISLEKPLAGLLCGIGIALAGYLLANAAYVFIASKKTVTVKGLSERIVKADMAIWPITVKETGDKLQLLQEKTLENRKKVKSFLTKFGFNEKEEITDAAMSVIDYHAQNYGDRPLYRYLVQTTVLLRSGKVDNVKTAMGETGQLINQGIVIDIPQYSPAAEFIFTGLNEIKPDMLKESTENARLAAEQFALDSKAQIGSIKSAQQGLFTLADRDLTSPDWKIVRVVSTIEFLLSK